MQRRAKRDSARGAVPIGDSFGDIAADGGRRATLRAAN